MKQRKQIVQFVAGALCIYLAALGYMFLFQRDYLYHPTGFETELATLDLPRTQELWLTTEDRVELRAWYASPLPGMRTVIFFHGNAGELSGRADKIRPFIEAGYGVLIPAYRGFSGNLGHPSESGFYTDALAAFDFVTDRTPLPPIVYGESLGSGVASWLAAQKDVAALILDAPFTSIADAAQEKYWYFPAYWVTTDRYDTASRLTEIDAPLLILHGKQDPKMPYHHAERLYELAQSDQKKLALFEDGAHSDLFDHGAFREISSFLDEAGL